MGISNKIKGTNTMKFIPFKDIPVDRRKDITYGRIVVDYRPQKEEPYHTRLTVGGNRINYPTTVSSPTADISTIKLLLNSVISTPGESFCTMDISNFYLGTTMERSEYMTLPLHIIPQQYAKQYKLQEVQHNGKVYISIKKGMYGLPQAGLLANKQLQKALHLDGYYPCQHTMGLWKHRWRPVTFTLVVDDFGVKYVGKTHAEHLLKCLNKYYEKSQ